MNIKGHAFLIVTIAITSVGIYALDQQTCHESPKYLVVEGSMSEDEVGTNFLIKYKSTGTEVISCKYIIEKDDFEIKNKWTEYFTAIHEDFLFLNSGGNPGGSLGLIIWDLKRRKKVFTGSYASKIDFSKPGFIEYWMETGDANRKNCPKYDYWRSTGNPSVIETKVTLNLSDFSVLRSSQTRCSPRS